MALPTYYTEHIINSLPGIFYLFNQTGKFLLWNKNFETVSGYTSEEISKMHLTNFFKGADANFIAQRIDKGFTQGKADGEAYFINKNGKQTPYYFTGTCIEVEGVPALIGMGIDISDRIQLQQELDKEKGQNQKITTAAVIKAQEGERSLLGLELHDNVNQVLTTVKLYTEMLGDGIGNKNDLVKKSLHHLQFCIDEIRSISKRLSAPTLGNISLIDSIKELVESVNLTRRINIVYSIEGLSGTPTSQDLHLAIYRIVQEQLNNILKHADASFAVIQIAAKENSLYLMIKDDGEGFDLQKQSDGIGIANMRTRAENLNGEFVILSSPGKGCILEVVLPCSPTMAPSLV